MRYRRFTFTSLILLGVLISVPPGSFAKPIEPASQNVHLWISDRYIAAADSTIIISQILLDTLQTPTQFFSEYIQYDNNVVQFIDVANGEQTPLPLWTITKTVTTPGEVQVSAVSSGAPLTDSGEIVRLIFRVVDTARAFQTTPFVDSAAFLGLQTAAISDTGLLRVIDGCTPIIVQDGRVFTTSMECSPNPASQSVTISYSLPEAEPQIELRLFDATGNLVRSLGNGSATAGWHTCLVNVSNLPNGTYFYELKTKSGYQFRAILVSH